MARRAEWFTEETLTRTDIAPLSAYDGGVPAQPAPRLPRAPRVPSSIPPMRARASSGVCLKGAASDEVTAARARDARWEPTTADVIDEALIPLRDEA